MEVLKFRGGVFEIKVGLAGGLDRGMGTCKAHARGV